MLGKSVFLLHAPAKSNWSERQRMHVTQARQYRWMPRAMCSNYSRLQPCEVLSHSNTWKACQFALCRILKSTQYLDVKSDRIQPQHGNHPKHQHKDYDSQQDDLLQAIDASAWKHNNHWYCCWLHVVWQRVITTGCHFTENARLQQAWNWTVLYDSDHLPYRTVTETLCSNPACLK